MSTQRSKSTSFFTAMRASTLTPRRRRRRRPGGSSGNRALPQRPHPLRTRVPFPTSVSHLLSLAYPSLSLCCTPGGQLFANAAFVVLILSVAGIGVRAQAISLELPGEVELALQPRWSQSGANNECLHRTTARRAACAMSIVIIKNILTDMNCSRQHPVALWSECSRRRNPSQALWLERDFV